MSSNSEVSAARYGKDNIRLCKVIRDEATKTHTVVEMTVCVLLEGDIQTAYTEGDNSVIVATDTMKNTVYILAKQNPVNPPELFASTIASHFPTKYPHIHTAHVKIITHRWTRISIDGTPHPHSFLRDGSETRLSEATAKRVSPAAGAASINITLKSGIQGLLVLKSTGSGFHGFIRDSYTTLPETWDRILSTEVDAGWEWGVFSGGLEEVRKSCGVFDGAWEKARDITLKIFAEDMSDSVQATMYKMAEKILEAVPTVGRVEYSLPNKHYFEIDMSWHDGLKNTGKDAEVYAPQSNPNGLIKCTISRPKTPKV